MSVFTLFVIALGLSMDAFAVAICKGLAMQRVTLKNSCLVGLWFGGFQALMPSAGYFLGSQFKNYITAFDHWIAFALLSLIGISMIREALSKEEKKEDASLDFKTMLLLALATSIDAMAAGISFAFLEVNILAAALFIGSITFILSAAGVRIGNVFGSRYKSKAEFAGGVALFLMGLKILFEHLGILW